jgi:Choline/Carnitine o-acyltransferase
MFRTAVTRQTEIMVQNILGNGIDIPLLGLREASREVEGEMHELFTDECYKIANCFLLSTSQVTELSTHNVIVIQHLIKNIYLYVNVFLHNNENFCTFYLVEIRTEPYAC